MRVADPQILARVTTRGYTAADMAEGQRLHRAAVEAVDAQAASAGAALLTTERARVAAEQARSVYQGLVQTVRAIFPANSSQRKALEVTGPMPTDTAEFIAAATTLFNNALGIAEIGVVLAKYGYDAPTLHREYELIVAYQQAVQAQALAKGIAQQATRAQNTALAELQQWTAQYTKIVQLALRSQPELLKALGIARQHGRSTARSAKVALAPEA